MPPVLSILLPTHNRCDSLEWALRSLEAQEDVDFEVLICGDGCTDGTAELASRWERKDSRFRWFDYPKAPGFGYANRNLALKEGSGKYIGFMAHDDLVFSDHYARLIQPMEDASVQLTVCRPLWVEDSGQIIPSANNLESIVAQERLENGIHTIPASCYLHRREARDVVGGWNESLPRGGDLELWLRIFQHYGRSSLRYLTEPGCLHFRAIWKMADHPDPQNFTIWHQLISKPGALPGELKVDMPAGMLPQEAMGRRLSGPGGAQWQESLRKASDHAMETYALAQEIAMASLIELTELNVRFVHEQERAEKWKAKTGVLQEKLAVRSAELKSLKESRRGWRLWPRR